MLHGLGTGSVRFGAETPVSAAASAMRERCRSESTAIACHCSRNSERRLHAGVECIRTAKLQRVAAGGFAANSCRSNLQTTKRNPSSLNR